VEGEARGTQEAISSFSKALKQGPKHADVDNVKMSNTEATPEDCEGDFAVR